VMLQVIFDFGFVLLTMFVFGVFYLQSPMLMSATATHSVSLATWTVLVGSATGMYHSSSHSSLQKAVTRALIAAVLMLPLAFGIFSLIPSHIASSDTMAYVSMGTVLAVIVHRAFGGNHRGLAVMRSRILVLGTGPLARQVSESLLAADPHASIVGFFPSPNERGHAVPSSQILASSASLAAAAAGAGVDEVIVAISERRSGSMSLRDLLECKINRIRVSDISTHFERRLGQIRLDHVNAGWLIFGDGFNQGFVRTAIKRMFDVISASALLVVTLPLMLITMLAIALEGRGPIFYRQERVGLNGKTFRVIKFRSMRCDAEEDGNPRWAMR